MDLSNIKIIFCDIDGTLLDDNKNFSNHTKYSIERITQQGILFVLVSGRDYLHTMKRAQDMKTSDIFISSGGALIYDMFTESIIYASPLDPEKVKSIVDFCNKTQTGIILRALTGKYFNKHLKKSDEIIHKYISLNDNTDYKSLFICQALVVGDTIEKTIRAKDYVNTLDLKITNFSSSFYNKKLSDWYYFDVNNKNVSKGNAIKYLLKRLNIKKEESLCFGDFINDIDMFEACNIKVAMGNAHPQLKEKADFIADTNNNDGVAKFLDKYF